MPRSAPADDRLGFAEEVGIDDQARRGGILLKLLGPAGAHDGRGHIGLAQHPGQRKLRQRAARLLGERLQLLHRSQDGGAAARTGWAGPSSRGWRASPAGRAAPGTYLPDSTPCASGDQTICEIPFAAQRGMTASSGLRQSSEYCGWLDTKRSAAGDRERAFDLLRRPFAEADVARLALAHHVAQRLHGLLDRRAAVVAMALIEIDMVDAQALQRAVDLLGDLRARQAAVGGAHRKEHLGRQDVRLARPARQNLAQEGLRRAAAVDIGGVDEVDAEVEGAIDAGARHSRASTPTP